MVQGQIRREQILARFMFIVAVPGSQMLLPVVSHVDFTAIQNTDSTIPFTGITLTDSAWFSSHSLVESSSVISFEQKEEKKLVVLRYKFCKRMQNSLSNQSN